MAKLPDMPATLLAFDTSTERLAVAVQGPRGLQAWDGDGGAAASAALLPRVRELLAAAGVSMTQLEAIAFGAGPGAFTGLRTACSVAQGLAFGLGLPVIPIDSLLIVAEAARGTGSPDAPAAGAHIAVAVDARMGELYAARYRWCADGWVAEQAPALWAPGDLADVWSAVWRAGPPPMLAGNGAALLRPAWPDVAAAAPERDRAAALMRLAQQAHGRGASVDAAQALPVYLRDKVALTTQERLDLKAAA